MIKYYFIAIIFFSGMTNVFAQEQFSVYFASDKYELNKSEIIRLNQWIIENMDVKVVGTFGFCDEDGSIVYNDTLAKRRIEYVYEKIKDKVKIREDFRSISFGELHTMSKVKGENRKVTLYYILPKDFSREDEIVKVKKAPEKTVTKAKPAIKYPSKLAFENPDGSTTTFPLDTIFMKRIAAAPKGEKIKLENLNFIINSYAVVSQSRPKLYELLYVLQKNPNLKIEVQGHLCCSPIDKNDLSTERAKAVYSFLVLNGIEKARLSYRGFGSTQPLYPLPEKTEKERAANRRVEVMIVDN